MFQHMVDQVPIMDRQGKFLYFSNHKVATISINRHALKHRTIIRKSHTKQYNNVMLRLKPKHMSRLFKFTVVRNPYDRMVSGFFYMQQHHDRMPLLVKQGINIKKMSFRKFVLEVFQKYGPDLNIHFHHQHPKVFTPDGVKFVDFVGRLENIKKDWVTICSKIGHKGELPKRNTTRHKQYWRYYKDKRVKAIISDIYAKDFETLGYSV